MSDTLPTTWPVQEHTLAKHAILRRYLDAWLPILSRQTQIVNSPKQEILYIDGFAGPGEYEGGEPGSPVIALRAALNHDKPFPRPVRFLFIEQRPDRYRHLLTVLERFEMDLKHSRQVILDPPREGDCDEVLSDLLERHERLGASFGPALAFLDQFGYSAVSLELIAKIMRYPQCEVFSYLDFKDMNRWISDSSKASAFTRAYGGEEWREAVALPGSRRESVLLDLYKKALRERAGVRFVQSFAMFDKQGVLLYWLVFCTNNLRGLEEMKRAMWSIDEVGTFRFSDKDNPGQLRLLDESFSQEWLAEKLERDLADRRMTVEEIKLHVLESTPCYRFKKALGMLEQRGRLFVPSPPMGRRQGSFSQDDMIVQFGQRSLF